MPDLIPGTHLYAAQVGTQWHADRALKELRARIKASGGIATAWRHLYAFTDGRLSGEYIQSNGVTVGAIAPRELVGLLIALGIKSEWRIVGSDRLLFLPAGRPGKEAARP